MKVLTILAALVLFAAIVVHSSPVEVGSIKQTSLSTAGLTVDIYRRFMIELRSLLTSGDDRRYGIPVLPPTSPTPLERNVFVELQSQHGQSIVVLMDVVNAYMIGYLNADAIYYFRGVNPEMFRRSHKLEVVRRLPFDGSYGELETAAGIGRAQLLLSVPALDQAIRDLQNTNMTSSLAPQARACMVVIQMVMEAARIRYIEGLIWRSIGRSFRPSQAMISLEDTWYNISEAFQLGNWPVTLAAPSGDRYLVDGPTPHIISMISLLFFTCQAQQNGNTFAAARSLLASNLSIVVESSGPICQSPERTVQLMGRDGLCAGMRTPTFPQGERDPLDLRPCGVVTWTLMRDGTIRPHDNLCMVPSVEREGSLLVVRTCSLISPPFLARWRFLEDGTIIRPASGLALTANGHGGLLSLESNTGLSRQGWVPSNIPFWYTTAIMGLNGLCLTTNANGLWVENCVTTGTASQRWSLFYDGTIRTSLNRETCINSFGHEPGNRVSIRACREGSANMRWTFRDGTLFNPVDDRVVMDVRDSLPSMRQIIMHPRTGNANQIWIPMFI